MSADKHNEIVTYCKSGRRSAQAELALEQHGCTNVVNGGGYEDLR